MKAIDIRVGQVYGYLTILEQVKASDHGDRVYKCKCQCGTICNKKATVIKIIEQRGNINSCGCRKRNKKYVDISQH